MQVVVGIRLHSVMFSAVRGVPVIGISYDVKVDGFMKYIDSSTCISLNDLTTDALCALVDKCMAGENDEEIKKASQMLNMREKENVIAAKQLLG